MKISRKPMILAAVLLMTVLFGCVWSVQAADRYPVEQRAITVGDVLRINMGITVRAGEAVPKWVCSDSKILGKKNGVYFGLKPGKCTLTLKTKKQTYAKYSVTVSKRKTVKKTYTQWIGGPVFNLPEGPYTGENIVSPKWVSSNKKIAVMKNGTVFAKKRGKCTLTLKNKYTTFAQYTIIVKQPVKKLTLNKKSLTMKKGASFTLKATFSPKTADNKKLVWRSSNTDVVTVTSSGKLKAKQRGSSTIYVSLKNTEGIGGEMPQAACEVRVVVPISKINLEQKSKAFVLNEVYPTIGDDFDRGDYSSDYSYVGIDSITPEEARDDLKISYASSNKNVVTVDKDGRMVPVGAGAATITVTAKNPVGTKTAKEKVTVVDMNDYYEEVPITVDNFLTYFGLAGYEKNYYNNWGELTDTYHYKVLTNKKFDSGYYYYRRGEKFQVEVEITRQITNYDGTTKNTTSTETWSYPEITLNENVISIKPLRVLSGSSIILLKKSAVKNVVTKTEDTDTGTLRYKEAQLVSGSAIARFNVEDGRLIDLPYIR